jgi:hypothetical protein
MDIEAWLRGLGLEQYVAAFRENNVEADVLLRLTAEDFTEIGVKSVGRRRKLLAATAELGSRSLEPPPKVATSLPTLLNISRKRGQEPSVGS